MSKYVLPVRGETVTIEFKRINDSRQIARAVETRKKPNLFNIRAAMVCHLGIPIALAPDWFTSAHFTFPYNCVGLAYCHRRDKWRAKTGRHAAISEALAYTGHDKVLNGEIMAAFLAEERRREKVKGPARTPRTGKPKPRRAGAPTRETLRHELAQAGGAGFLRWIRKSAPETWKTWAEAYTREMGAVDIAPIEDAKFYSPKPNGSADPLPAE